MKFNCAKLLGLAGIIITIGSCSKMDSTYKKYLENGEIIYPSGPDSLLVHPGKNRIGFSWILNDPDVNDIKIFWNDRNDSAEVPIKSTAGDNNFQTIVENIPEGSYVFELFSYDGDGHSSVLVSAVGNVYGERYEESLLTRLPRVATFGMDTLSISWDSPENKTEAGTRVSYIDTNGIMQYRVLSPDSSILRIGDYDFEANHGLFKYETMYLPDPLALDTVHTLQDSMQVVKMKEYADNHEYDCVFPDDALNPHYLYFLGYPKGKKHEMVWKYDIIGDSIIEDYPKKVTDVFDIPYPDKIPEITSVGWFYFEDASPELQSYFFGNGYYYTYNVATREAGALHPVTDLTPQPWPPKNFSVYIDCGLYSPARKANYPFAGSFYEKMSTDAKRKWGYANGKEITSVWEGIPDEFMDRGLNGVCYIESTRMAYFFSGSEFVVFDEKGLTTISEIRSISLYYKGL